MSNRDHLIRIDEAINSGEAFTFPSKMLHFTERRFVDAILRDGLIPGSPRHSEFGCSLGAYLTPDEETIEYSDDLVFDDPVIIEVDTIGLGLRLDPEYFCYRLTNEHAQAYVDNVLNDEVYWAAYSRDRIPPHRLKVKS